LQNATSYEGTFLHLAAKCNSLELAKRLADSDIDIHARDVEGRSALHFALEQKSEPIAMFIANLPNFDATRENIGEILSLSNGVCDLLSHFASKNYDIKNKDEQGRNFLHHIAANDESPTKYLQEMIKNNLLPTNILFIPDNDGCTALHLASSTGNAEVVNLLLKAGASPGIRNNDGWSSLHLAAKYGNYECVELLVRADEGLCQALTNDKRSVLHLACSNSVTDVVKYFVGLGLDPSLKDSSGKNVIHFAAEAGQLQNLKYFLNLLPENINLVDNVGSTALQLASRKGSTKIVGQLIKSRAVTTIENNVTLTPLHTAVKYGNLGCVKMLVEADETILERRIPLNQQLFT